MSQTGAEILRSWRLKNGHTQEWLAEAIGISQTRLSGLERGIWGPSRLTASRIHEATKGEVPFTCWDKARRKPRAA